MQHSIPGSVSPLLALPLLVALAGCVAQAPAPDPFGADEDGGWQVRTPRQPVPGRPEDAGGAPPDARPLDAQVWDARLPDVQPPDMGQPDAQWPDMQPADAGQPDTQPPTPDAAIPDAGPDAQPLDAAPPSPDADPPFVPGDPPPPCAIRPIDDALGAFEPLPTPPGQVTYVGDVDGDGRAEVVALTAERFGLPPEEWDRTYGHTVFGWRDGAFVDQGDIFGFSPQARFDVPGAPGGLLGVGWYLLDNPSVATGLALRVDDPADPLRFDVDVPLAPRGPGGLPPVASGPNVAVADADDDGVPEVLLGYGVIYRWRDGGLVPVWRAEEADPADEVAWTGGRSNGRVAAGDFDGDGRLEVVLSENGGTVQTGPRTRESLGRVRIFEHVVGDTWHLRARLPGLGWSLWLASVGDLDGDGRPELATGERADGCLRIQFWAAPADDTYTRLAQIDLDPDVELSPTGGASAFADLDGDGTQEWVLALRGVITAWRWDGADLVQLMGRAACAECMGSRVFVGDVDGDGRDDIAYSERFGGEVPAPNGIRVLRWPAP